MRKILLSSLLTVGLFGCSGTRDMGDMTPPPPPAPTAPTQASYEPMAECDNGKAGEYDCGSVDLVSHISVEEMGSGRGNDIWGWTDSETGIEYALVGMDDGTVFVSLENPASPLNLGKMPTTTEASVWRDLKTYADHVFVGSEAPGHGMQIFDLTRLRGLSADPARTFEPDALYEGFGSSHNIVMDEESGFVYGVGAVSNGVGTTLPASCGPKGFHAVDVRDPQNPKFSTCFSDAERDVAPRSGPGYTHDAQCLVYDGPDADYTGKQLCFAANEDVVTIFDVSDKSNVTIISMANYPRHAYSHQGWLTEDQRYFLLNDELDEISGNSPTQRTLVFDFEDLDNPSFAYEWDSGLTVIDHNNYILGDFSYQSNYKAGLRIIDVSKVAEGTLTEAAFFDTFPQGQDVQFGGQWSNFPYFDSGLVIANDSQNGLFVLKPNLDGPSL
ncbi:choice-of-anchor B family protein [Rubricoccus marinus]|nr:choice-of-anchor B family protein [Rubricoccus marinus]